MKRILVAVGLSVVLASGSSGCGHQARITSDFEEGMGPEGEDHQRYSRDLEFGSAVDMQFRDTEAHIRNGRFREAIRSSQTLFRDHGLDAERRARALLLWARAEGSSLNPERDVASAIARLELLLEDFEQTSAAREAKNLLRRLRRQS